MTAPGHDLSDDDVDARLRPVARRALREHGLPPDSVLTLLNVSENATYAIDDPVTGERSVLRLHRRGYHDATAIESELAWLAAIRSQTGLRSPRVLAADDGRRVLTLIEDGEREPRYAVRFEWLPGTEPTPDDAGLPEWFAELGAITARLHQHAREWSPPNGFRRFSWDYDGAFGAVARWGRWQDGIAVGFAERETLARLDATLRRRLAAYGAGPDRYGLVHADLRLANLLVHDGETSLIDFDDCGQGWFLYDFGSAVSFFEHDPRIPELAGQWLTGYRTVRPLPAADAAELPSFVMMRRLLLVAWIGSHAGTELARSMGAEYTETSCALADTYLSRFAEPHSLILKTTGGTMFTPLDGCSVIVTGASKGIGLGIARVFARSGADVLLAARNGQRLAAVVEQLQDEGKGRLATVAADVSRPADCRRIAEAAIAAFGGIDVLCANAGIFPASPIAELTEQDVDEVFAVNVKGSMFMVQACLPALAASGRGRVVLTSSITGPLTGVPGWSAYGASKAAQLGFLRTAAIELAPQRITVNAVQPGNVVTEGLTEMGQEYRRGMEAAIPQHRLGSVEDIGYAALFLASEQAGYITGQTIVVDGGQVLPESQAALDGI